MKKMNKANISSILTGLLCGIIMALIMLYMMIRISFRMNGFSFLLVIAAGCAVPLCLGFVRKMNLSASLTEITAVVTSFLITCLYGLAAGRPADLAAENMLIREVVPLSALVHGCAAAAVVLWNRMTIRD